MAEILIIDDDESVCYSLSRMVCRMGHEATCAGTLAAGLEKARSSPFDVVFLDVRMPDGNGLDCLPKIQEAASSPEVIIMTGFGDPDSAELAIKSGAWDYVQKGSSVKETMLPLVRALQYRQEKASASQPRSVVVLSRDDIVGSSQRIRACLENAAQAAASEANVLISGETGTGKEVFARVIHHNSARSKGNFVVVDCAALPETLVESLLFGHEKGSFTGAEKAREGLILQANGGTLFLDEVGELPFSLQKAFLRVLQEHKFRPVGGSQEVKSDFRLIAATNRNLDEMVKAGQFRSDLLFRLRSFGLELPPLRERPEDIKELCRFYVDRFCERYGLPPKGFSPDFLEALTSYPWPGNVRELANTIERALAAARFEPILFGKHLPTSIRVELARASMGKSRTAPDALGTGPRQDMPPLHDFRESVYLQAEKQYLHELMALTEGHIKEACRISGLSQSRIYALLEKHGVSKG